jgi:transcription initiation factor TFIIH subunit 1
MLVEIKFIYLLAQKISTEGKAKVQLQLVLHDDTSTVFHFVSPEGPEHQLKERDKVKDQLAILLPKFKQKIDKELEQKKRILVENPHIYQLYNDLVVAQLIPADEFWSNFVDVPAHLFFFYDFDSFMCVSKQYIIIVDE